MESNPFKIDPGAYPRYYRRDGTPYPPGEDGLLEWARDFEDRNIRSVAYDETPYGDSVSTIWEGLDSSLWPSEHPLVFETMIFSSTSVGYDRKRTSTEEEARAAHAEALTRLQEAIQQEHGPCADRLPSQCKDIET